MLQIISTLLMYSLIIIISLSNKHLEISDINYLINPQLFNSYVLPKS